MNWKKDLPKAFVVIVVLTIVEVLLQKGPYSIVKIIMSTTGTMMIFLLIRFIFFSFKRSKTKNN